MEMLTSILVVLIITTSMVHCHNHGAYNHDNSYPSSNGEEWMKQITDEMVLLSQLSLPGTHNSLSSETQVLSLDSQLKMGIRVLDVHLKVISGQLRVYHEMADTGRTFVFVLDTLNQFLTTHPSEVVFMRVRDENNKDGPGTSAFLSNYNGEITRVRHLLWRNHANPTLGETRGKLLVFDDFSESSGSRVVTEHGLNYKHFKSTIQDEDVIVTPIELYFKWKSVREHAGKTSAGSSTSFYFNYLSGFGGGSAPRTFVASGHYPGSGNDSPRLFTGTLSKPVDLYPDFPKENCVWLPIIGEECMVYYEGINILFYDKISYRRLGIVMMDFPGESLCSKIYGSNPLGSATTTTTTTAPNCSSDPGDDEDDDEDEDSGSCEISTTTSPTTKQTDQSEITSISTPPTEPGDGGPGDGGPGDGGPGDGGPGDGGDCPIPPCGGSGTDDPGDGDSSTTSATVTPPVTASITSLPTTESPSDGTTTRPPIIITIGTPIPVDTLPTNPSSLSTTDTSTTEIGTSTSSTSQRPPILITIGSTIQPYPLGKNTTINLNEDAAFRRPGNVYRACHTPDPGISQLGIQLNDRQFRDVYVRHNGINAIWVQHILTCSRGKLVKTEWSSDCVDNILDTEVDLAYTRVQQRQRYQNLRPGNNWIQFVTSEGGQRYFAKGHLCPRADVAHPISSYFYINSAPQWQVINNGLWKEMEIQLRLDVSNFQTRFLVTTGTKGVLTDVGGNSLFLMDGVQPIPIPLYFWKVVRAEQQPGSGQWGYFKGVISINDIYSPHSRGLANTPGFQANCWTNENSYCGEKTTCYKHNNPSNPSDRCVTKIDNCQPPADQPMLSVIQVQYCCNEQFMMNWLGNEFPGIVLN